jgi:hypothetical protein
MGGGTVRVTLVAPESYVPRPAMHGEHHAYYGRSGALIALAGVDGAWVQFDGEKKYVGCPRAHLCTAAS